MPPRTVRAPQQLEEDILKPRHHRSPAERRSHGKSLRERVAREEHGGWKAPKDRRDPVDIVTASNEGRQQELVPIRHGRMLQSPFAFYRGSAALMAADLAKTPVSGLRVQACGDAHLMNFGGFATPERGIVFDINDLDETLPAPWEWDLKRLVASLVLAGRHLGMREGDATRAAHATAHAYREHMADYAVMRVLDIWYDKISLDRFLANISNEERRARVQRRVEKMRERTTFEHDFPKLAEETGTTPRIRDNPPLIFHSTEIGPKELKERVAAGLARYRSSLPEHVRVLFDRFHYCDTAVKVVGVGSVGTLCLVMLFMSRDDDPLFLQVKQANASVLEPYAGKSLHENHGERVVTGQRLLQAASDIFLGWSAGDRGLRHFYVRQLRDMKMGPIIEDWDPEQLEDYGRLCAWALARGHARSGDPAMISGYIGSSEAFDEAMCEFAIDYADQVQEDYKSFVRAAREGRIKATVETP
jgi:uncharacterized protein (DUF2252 family)